MGSRSPGLWCRWHGAMFHVVLVEPEIPPNTGNIGRLCVATGSRLHLVEPLGFRIDDRQLKRAGLDYWAHVDLCMHASLEAFLAGVEPSRQCWFLSTRASNGYAAPGYRDGDYLVFGRETRGLPGWLLEAHPGRGRRIPMDTTHVRSLNLASSAAVILYEALRQTGWSKGIS